MGADSLAENTPNAPEFICPICLPKPKSSGFQCKKASLGFRSPWYWIISQTFWMKKGHFIFLTKFCYSGHCFPFRKLTAITLNKFSHIFFFQNEWLNVSTILISFTHFFTKHQSISLENYFLLKLFKSLFFL